MLQALLDSWAKLTFPDDVTPVFIIVDNDPAASMQDIVRKARGQMTVGALIYVVEPEIGIPQARNAAVRAALANDASVIAFVDDDETVAEDWFIHLFDTYRRTGAQLIGGPVRAFIPQVAASAKQRIIQAGVRDRYRKVEDRAAQRLRSGRLEKMAILTNNWFADAALFTRLGLSFDDELRLTGGSDTKFYRDAVAKGVRTSWAPQAIVFETIPDERLSLAYQYRRGKEQSKTSIRAKIRDRGRLRVLPMLATSIAIRCVGTAALLVSIPFSGGRSAVAFSRSCGWIVGRAAGFIGRKSELYGKVTGE